MKEQQGERMLRGRTLDAKFCGLDISFLQYKRSNLLYSKRLFKKIHLDFKQTCSTVRFTEVDGVGEKV